MLFFTSVVTRICAGAQVWAPRRPRVARLLVVRFAIEGVNSRLRAITCPGNTRVLSGSRASCCANVSYSTAGLPPL